MEGSEMKRQTKRLATWMTCQIKRLTNGVNALGTLSGSVLVIGTLVVVTLHLLHGIWAPIPDVLPFVPLPR
jgi:hypothetical protein